MKKIIITFWGILFLSANAFSQADEKPMSAGADLFGAFRNTLELNFQYKPLPYLAVAVTAGNQFPLKHEKSYQDNQENLSSYSAKTNGLFAKVGPRFILLNSKTKRESLFIGFDIIYSVYSIRAEAEVETYYGPRKEYYDKNNISLPGYSINAGTTLYFTDYTALDLGARLASFSTADFPFIIEKYNQPGFGASSSENGDERISKELVFSLTATMRVFF